jgi:hypothetical protein
MSPLRIVLLGYVVRGPIGGMAWHHLNYVKGLTELGHDVLFIEDSDEYPACYDPRDHSMTCDPEYGLRFSAHAFSSIDHDQNWCYFDAHTHRWHGPASENAIDFCRDADLVLNVSGVNPLRDWTRDIPVRVLIDTDPLFTQLRNLQEPEWLEYSLQHNAFFTFGENIPEGRSTVPDDGILWLPTRQPVSLESWPFNPAPSSASYSTVMQWDSYRTRKLGQQEFGMKSQSFLPFMDLPAMVEARLSLAVGGENAPRQKLQAAGWQVDDPMTISESIESYRDYITHSRGEWSVAKHGYVEAHTGWFSERSACYLASGRPVIVQDTGWSACPDGSDGLRQFSDLDGARSALQEIEENYERHSVGARKLAEEFFSPEVVLSPLLQRALATQTGPGTG